MARTHRRLVPVVSVALVAALACGLALAQADPDMVSRESVQTGPGVRTGESLATSGGRQEAADPFPHPLHVEAGVECATCHLAEDGEALAEPSAATCGECHGEGEVEVPVAQGPTPHEWIFPHETHVAAVGDCTTCHAAAEGEPRATVAMSTCLECHGDAADMGCRSCHQQLGESVAPGPGSSPLLDHSQAWKLRHGEASRLAEDSCTWCHAVPDDCTTCHLDVPPRSHTRLFKLQTHGVEADLDRQRCQACHVEQDFCAECHAQVRPLSHTPDWGHATSQATGHCGSCHLPLQDTSCSTCHTSLAAHQEVAPADHGGGWGNPANDHCGSCHLPLADTSCATCHSSLDAHQEVAPADHAGGWGNPANDHCGSCHLPLQDTSCATCHDSLDAHATVVPADHASGWGNPANNHCGSCHLPLQDTSCATCHESLDAHASVAPADHTGGWGAPSNGHCNSCHLPLRDTSCATCHTEGDLVAHQEAPPPPSHAAATWGDPGNDHCGSCHLPLRDTECAVCHTDLDGHERPPQSHTPSFTSRPTYGHCDSCHFPVADEETCSVCHRNDDHRTSPEMPDWHDTISDCLYCHPASDPVPHQLTDQETCLRCHELQ